METFPYVVLAVGVSILAIVAAVRFILLHHEARNKVTVLILLGSVIWLLMSAFEVTSDSLPTKLVFFKMQYVGLLIVPTGWLILAMQLSGYERWIKRSNLVMLSAVPVITLLLILSNEFHGLMWSTVTLNSVDPFLPLNANTGLGYLLLFHGYSYAVLILAIIIFVRRLLASRNLYRRQAVPVIFVCCIPWALSAAWNLNPSLFRYIDLTPLALTIATSITLWRLANLQGADIIPVAHEMIFDSINEAVIILDSQTRIVELNPKAEQLVGHTLSYALGMPVEQIWAEWTNVKKQLDSGTEKVKEASFNVGEQKKIYEMQTSYLSGITSSHPNLLIILRDFTERKRMEEELERHAKHLEELVEAKTADLATSARTYRLLVDNMADAVFTLDLKGNLTFPNPQTEKMTGYSVQQLRSMNIKELIAPEDLPGVLKRLEARSRGVFDLSPTQFDILRADGTRLPIEIHTSLLREGDKPVGVQGIARDITERKRMEDALRESEARFRELADLLPQIVFETDEKGVLTYFNKLGLLSLGYSEEDLRRGFNVFQAFPPEDAKRAMENMRLVMKGEQTGPNEYRLLRRDGTSIPIIIYSSPIIREGKPVGLRGIIVDITERKQMEEELLRSRQMAAVGETAAMVGHDLRNPLQGLAGTLYLLRKHYEGIPVEYKKVNEFDAIATLGMMEKSVGYMDKIISDLQNFAAPIQPWLTKISTPKLLKETLSSVTIPPDVKVSVNVDKDTETLNVDPDLIKRVFMNLITNAVQAMPHGGELKITAQEIGKEELISFQDTGVGISKEILPKLFVPFFTTKAQGQGLGLPVCKRVMEAHGGTITVESTVGKGSTFTVKLPIPRSMEKEPLPLQ